MDAWNDWESQIPSSSSLENLLDDSFNKPPPTIPQIPSFPVSTDSDPLTTFRRRRNESPAPRETNIQWSAFSETTLTTTDTLLDIRWKKHKVVRTDSLPRIAKLYGTSEEAIRRINPRLKGNNVQILDYISIPIRSTEEEVEEVDKSSQKSLEFEEQMKRDLANTPKVHTIPRQNTHSKGDWTDMLPSALVLPRTRVIGDPSLLVNHQISKDFTSPPTTPRASMSSLRSSTSSTQRMRQWMDKARSSFEGLNSTNYNKFSDEQELETYRSSVDE